MEDNGALAEERDEKTIENTLCRVGHNNTNSQPPTRSFLPLPIAPKAKSFIFYISVYWPFVPDVNGFHFGIQTEMDDLLNAVGLMMRASMNDAAA